MDSKDRQEMKEMQQLIDKLLLQVERLFGEVFMEFEEEEEEEFVAPIPIELYDYMKENCDSMIMGIS